MVEASTRRLRFSIVSCFSCFRLRSGENESVDVSVSYDDDGSIPGDKLFGFSLGASGGLFGLFEFGVLPNLVFILEKRLFFGIVHKVFYTEPV